jgi:hypothetical protein
MKATNFRWDVTGMSGVLDALAHPQVTVRLPRRRQPKSSTGSAHDTPATPAPPGLVERFDRWLFRLRQREQEAYLAGAQNIFELEERMRRLERSVGNSYY